MTLRTARSRPEFSHCAHFPLTLALSLGERGILYSIRTPFNESRLNSTLVSSSRRARSDAPYHARFGKHANKLLNSRSLLSQSRLTSAATFKVPLNVCVREALADFLAQVFFVGGLVSPADDEALQGVEEFEPIFERRFGDVLPLVEALFAVKKFPLASDVLGVNLELDAFVGDAFPTDFSFGHGG